jgi:hypothetical protein
LLLYHVESLADQKLTVEVTVTRSLERPRRLAVQATISGFVTPPENLWAKLIWGNQTKQAQINAQGQVDFGELSLETLSEDLAAGIGNFDLIFEAEEST